jgi:ABC-type thiamine transport system ATPase subunit
MARKRWPHVQRLVEERRALLLDLQRAALDQPGRECVRALVDATRESEALIVAFATRRATTVR